MKNIISMTVIAFALVLTGCSTTGANTQNANTLKVENNPYTTRSHNGLSVEQEAPAGYVPYY